MSYFTSHPSISVTKPTRILPRGDHTLASITVDFDITIMSTTEEEAFFLEVARALLPGGRLALRGTDTSFQLEHGTAARYFLAPVPPYTSTGYKNYCRVALPLEGWYDNENSKLMANYIFVNYRKIYDAFFNDYLLAMRTMRIFVTQIDTPDTVKSYNDYLRYWLSTRTPWDLRERRWISSSENNGLTIDTVIGEREENTFTFFDHGIYRQSATPIIGTYFYGTMIPHE